MAKKPARPIGESIRDLINPALADSRCPEIQNDILNSIFFKCADQLRDFLERDYRKIFNEVSYQHEEIKHPYIIESLTLIDPETGEAKYAPIKRIGLPIATTFTQFTADEIKAMPGFIALHEAAREENVAIRVFGLTVDESKNSTGLPMPVYLILDATKTYVEGALDNSQMYPDLPPQKADFDRGKPGDFTF